VQDPDRQLSGSKDADEAFGAVLLAEVGGDEMAAIGIFDGNVIADRARSGLRLRLRLHLDRLFVRAAIAVVGG
jgi:hypothetical protein